jgi:nitrile hydratase accessory protein
VFAAPWQAQAFAMALTLQQRGIFTWAEWAEMLGAARTRAATEGAPDTGETYYQDWLAALEQMVTAKGLADAAALSRTRDAWNRAAERTPHGTPIELGAEDSC